MRNISREKFKKSVCVYMKKTFKFSFENDFFEKKYILQKLIMNQGFIVNVFCYHVHLGE